jgi:hypothetical protein
VSTIEVAEDIFCKQGNAHVGLEVLTVIIMKSSIWDGTPWSSSEGYQRFGGVYFLHFQDRRAELLLMLGFLLVSSLTYTPILKIGAVCSSETSVKFYQIIPKKILLKAMSIKISRKSETV